MTNLDIGQAMDLSGLADRAKKEAQEEAEIRAIVGDATEVEKAAQLPEPKGWSILCAVPAAEEYELASGLKLAKPDAAKKVEENATVVLFVVGMGDLCYKDENKFPTGAWCKKGDFVLVRAYAGTRFKIHGREFRIINDDTVIGTVQDPRGYERA
jgi:co-chaperonin GroES (HSP10)